MAKVHCFNPRIRLERAVLSVVNEDDEEDTRQGLGDSLVGFDQSKVIRNLANDRDRYRLFVPVDGVTKGDLLVVD